MDRGGQTQKMVPWHKNDKLISFRLFLRQWERFDGFVPPLEWKKWNSFRGVPEEIITFFSVSFVLVKLFTELNVTSIHFLFVTFSCGFADFKEVITVSFYFFRFYTAVCRI